MQLRSALSLGSVALLFAGAASAQDAPFHASFRDRFDVGGSTYSDVWGSGTTAYIGRFGLNKVDLVDVSNPDSISLRTTITVPSPNNGASAQDVKVGQSAFDPSKTLAFIAYDASGPDTFGIYDVTNPNSPSLLTTVSVASMSTSHNTSYRADGWIATCNSFESRIALVDLSSYDPSSPPATITSADYVLSGLGSGFVHDIQLTDNYLFVSEWDSLQVWDVSNLASSAPTYLGEVRGFSNHAVWSTPDGRYIASIDERSGGALRLWKFTDNGSSITIDSLDSVTPPSSGLNAAYSYHNPVFFGDRLYASSYNAGTIVYQIDRTTDTFEKVASYDTSTTSPTGFDGCWGVYPYLGEDRVLLSDLENGLYVIDFSAVEFVFPTARPTTVAPFQATTVQVNIGTRGAKVLDGATPTLHASIDGGAFTTSALVNLGGGIWEATLPALSCGSKVDYYFSAEDTGGESFFAPAEAPGNVYTAYAAFNLTTVFEDNFNTNKGWSVSNSSVSNGAWERGTPIDSGMNPNLDDPRDSGNKCYVTENGTAGASVGTYDLDGGPTTLTSPTLDFSAGDGIVSFSAWQASSVADAAHGLKVQVSNDNGSSWTTVKTISGKSGGWTPHTFRVSDYVSPSAQVKVRFRISDNPNNAITEGGVDNFRAELLCSPAASSTFRNGTGINASCYFATAPVLGEQWDATVTHSGHPGATFTAVEVYAAAGTGPIVAGGEFLVDLGSQRLVQSLQTATGTQDVHSFSIPADTSFAGTTLATQGVILGGAGYELCNAYDIVVGF
ncbi:MAG TPA: hypothetical protein ENJ09_15205 [Planctomycetes bacterium]|nr:hypothetical protein [Planctomycetota bacterium]